jgi:hypothetical protein
LEPSKSQLEARLRRIESPRRRYEMSFVATIARHKAKVLLETSKFDRAGPFSLEATQPPHQL